MIKILFYLEKNPLELIMDDTKWTLKSNSGASIRIPSANKVHSQWTVAETFYNFQYRNSFGIQINLTFN